MERFWILNRDGQKLSGICFVPEIEPRFVLVAAHGFRGRKENSGKICMFAEKVCQMGGILIAFDFAGSGESEGLFAEMTLSRQAHDLRAVMDYAVSRWDLPLFVLGRSFGGSTAIAACADDNRVAGLILWSTPVLLENTFERIMPQEMKRLKNGETVLIQDGEDNYSLGPVFAMDFANHDLIECLKEIQRPILAVHGNDDDTVLPENVALIKQHSGGPVELHMIDGADHRFTACIQRREDISLQWIAGIINVKE